MVDSSRNLISAKFPFQGFIKRRGIFESIKGCIKEINPNGAFNFSQMWAKPSIEDRSGGCSGGLIIVQSSGEVYSNTFEVFVTIFRTDFTP